MKPADDKPDRPTTEKTTAPAEMPCGLSAREAARLWGTGSLGGDGIRRQYPYSKT
jgi:hypothetical protein